MMVVALPGGPPDSREEFLEVGARSPGAAEVAEACRGEVRRLERGRLRAGDSSLRRRVSRGSGLRLRLAPPRDVELGCSLSGANRGRGRTLLSTAWWCTLMMCLRISFDLSDEREYSHKGRSHVTKRSPCDAKWEESRDLTLAPHSGHTTSWRSAILAQRQRYGLETKPPVSR